MATDGAHAAWSSEIQQKSKMAMQHFQKQF